MKKVLSFFLSLVLALVLVKFLLGEIANVQILTILKQTPLHFVVLAFLLYGITTYLRSVRFQYLIGSRRSLFSVVCIHSFANVLFPMRLGELSFPYLLRKHNVRATKSLSTLVFVRVFDLLLVGLIFLFGYIVSSNLPELASAFVFWALLIVGMALVFLFLLLFQSKAIARLISRIAGFFGLHTNKAVAFILEKGNQASTSLDVLRKKNYAIIFVLSILIWIAYFSFVYMIISSVGITLMFSHLIIAISLYILGWAIPVQGVAGLGTINGIWAIIFFSLGLSKELAISSGFAQHIIVVLIIGLYGGIGMLLGLWTSKREKPVHD